MEFLITNLLWWHWIAFGIVLVVAEIFVPLFVIIWFGLSAIIVGILTLFFTLSFNINFAIWIILSTILLALWFKYFKKESIDKSGQDDFRLDTKGVVTEDIKKGYKGKVHFDMPVLGSSDWYATSDEDIESGQRVEIDEVNGQLLKVKKIQRS